MRKVFTVLTMLLVAVAAYSATVTTTIEGFMPGNIDRQTVTQEPGTFGRYTESESKMCKKLNEYGEPYMDMSFVRSFDDRPFDIEKASEMPIKPKFTFTREERLQQITNKVDDRPFIKVKTGPKLTKLVRINLPQEVRYGYNRF